MDCSSKDQLLDAIRTQTHETLATLEKALADSHENATGEETKSDGKYDTRAIEAAYLAEAQREQMEKARTNHQRLANFQADSFDDRSPVAVGALVEAENDEGLVFYFLAPAGGGLTVTYLGCPAVVVTPESLAFQQLHGRKVGDHIDALNLEILGLE